MREIDMEQWGRKKHFERFNGFDYPHFNLTATVDISICYPYLKSRGLPFFQTMVYVVSAAANAVPEFRQRIRGNQVIEHDVVHPSVTVMGDDEIFSFCHITYCEKLRKFFVGASRAIDEAKHAPTLTEAPQREDDVLYMTCLPWIHFTGLMHPIHMHPVDSIPRIAWGKFIETDGRITMPLSVQAHHALADGWHVAKYMQTFQELLDHPERFAG